MEYSKFGQLGGVMRANWFGLVLLVTATAASATPPGNCKGLKTPAARLACYEKADSAPRSEDSGKIKGVITWQYNNFVGTKGDVGASIVAIRRPVPDALQKLSPPERGLLSLGVGLPSMAKQGIYVAQADGFGNYSIDGVSTGSYEIFVFSSKTRPGPDDYMTNACKSKYDEFFKNEPNYKDLAFKIHKVYCTSVTVENERENTLSHDFGNTYI